MGGRFTVDLTIDRQEIQCGGTAAGMEQVRGSVLVQPVVELPLPVAVPRITLEIPPLEIEFVETIMVQACPAVYDPVCGADGITYGNICEAHAADVEFFSPGECGCSPTHYAYDPVCGADGASYRNACEAENQAVEFYSPGKCSCPAITYVYDPVCGADGNTYRNACEATSAGVEILHPGQCMVHKAEP